MGTIVDAAVSAGARIGRYFSVVSLVPSLVFVLYVAALLRAGAWNGQFAPAGAVDALRTTDVGDVAALVTVSLALGIVMHPFQFTMIQLMEGYWGTSRLANRLMEARARNHRDRLLDLKDAKEDHDAALVDLALATQSESVAALLRANPEGIPSVVATVASSRAGDGMLGPLVRQESTARAIGTYPSVRRVRPTRLGNALRMHEDTAGRQYGLRAIPIAPHLSLTAEPDHVAYQADARQELDLAVRVCVLAALATAVTAVLLADDRAWVLLALGPYAVAYLAYRGAVFAAHAYGTSVATVLDLNRFGLYERLRLPAPDDADQERTQNASLMAAITGSPQKLAYRHPPVAGADAAATAGPAPSAPEPQSPSPLRQLADRLRGRAPRP